MKKWLWIASVLVLLSLMVATPALAGTVTQTKTKTLPIAGEVTFTSSFRAADGDTIAITIWPADSSVTISDVQLVRITPKPKQGCDGCSIEFSGTGDHDVDVTLHNTLPGKSTFHLWLYLSTGEHLGVNVLFGPSDTDTPTVTITNPVASMIAAFFDLDYTDVEAWHDEGIGYGEIAMACFVAQLSGADPATIIELRQDGSGWGEIFKDTVGFAGNQGYNLGLIVSGREIPTPVQNLADFCELEVQELLDLAQETKANFSTIRMACRLAQQVEDEGVTVESIITMRQGGMSWREIREELDLLPGSGDDRGRPETPPGWEHGKKGKGPK